MLFWLSLVHFLWQGKRRAGPLLLLVELDGRLLPMFSWIAAPSEVKPECWMWSQSVARRVFDQPHLDMHT